VIFRAKTWVFFTLFLSSVNFACSGNGVFESSPANDSSDSEELENSPSHPEKPTDDSEGVPGYLVDPEHVLIARNDNGDTKITIEKGAVQTNDGKPGPVVVEVHVVSSNEFAEASEGKADQEIPAQRILQTTTDAAGELIINVTLPKEFQLLMSFVTQKVDAISIQPTRDNRSVMAMYNQDADQLGVIPLDPKTFFPKPKNDGESAAEVEKPASCDGLEHADACWYLGAAGQSCTAVCEGHGGYNEATNIYTGSGGNLAQCREVLDGLKAAYFQSQNTASGAYGCSIYATTATRWTFATTADASLPVIQRACACNN
jgi:hypothetical protein